MDNTTLPNPNLGFVVEHPSSDGCSFAFALSASPEISTLQEFMNPTHFQPSSATDKKVCVMTTISGPPSSWDNRLLSK